ncbi:hypothetical protein [Acaryochloris sp. IP29b_bin.137]|uniref:hypothetical protein n=1 Tax=Acaryochloris sp. IP29b_bin.137 TaxID=2969217 RepID=UPI0026029437|nr:hypothetical protein [Acaryochloris sp. IP29b_bin.137]
MNRSRLAQSCLRGYLILFAIIIFSISNLFWQTQPSVAQISPGCGTPGQDGAGTMTGIVNTYFSSSSNGNLNAGATAITLGGAQGATTPIQAGDLLMIIQMQDASINGSNTSSYGNGVPGDPGSGASALNSAGAFEYIVATSSVPLGGGNLTFVGEGSNSGLIHTYRNQNFGPQGQQRYQILRVPQYRDRTLGAGLTALPWNGSVGGVLAVDISGQLNMNGNTINVSGLGFRGGGGRQLPGGPTGVGADTDYRNLSTYNFHASKGEGISGSPRFMYDGSPNLINTGIEGYPNGSHARGAPGNAGGGGNDGNVVGNDQNTGGGGGSNGGRGGRGGNAWFSNEPYGGFGGAAFLGSAQRLVMGGGGGAGTRNNSSGIQSSGGRGGGMVLIRTQTLIGTGTINANGESGINPANDGGGGGGAGGSVLVTTQRGGLGTLTINTRGGNGADAWPTQGPGPDNINSHGPGGGGGGGFVLYAAPDSAPVVNVQPGLNGTSTTSQDPFGAEPGQGGQDRLIDPDDIPGTHSGASCSTPKLLLVKRITAINGNRTANPNDNTPLNLFVDDPTQQDDNASGWPSDYLKGALNAGLVRPGNEIEYTIYFLNAGGSPAFEVQICDRIQNGQTFQPAAFTAGADAELQLGASPVFAQTAAPDSSDRTQFVSGVVPARACNLSGPNENGILILDLTGNPGSGLPNLNHLSRSTGQGMPNNSYGLLRFRTTVNNG